MNQFESFFDIDRDLIYLNSANLSITPQSVLEAMKRYTLEFNRNPTLALENVWGKLAETQNCLAQFLNFTPESIFLRENITSAMNQFLLGIPLPRNSEILVSELEYGSISNIARFRAERDGLRWRILKMPQTFLSVTQLTERSLVESILSQLRSETSLLVLSHIVAATGMKIPIEEIAKETRRKGVLLAVDGAYAVGVNPIQLGLECDIDFYGASLYKWLLGPRGTGIGWIHPKHQSSILPLTAGWNTFSSVSSPHAFSKSEFQNRMVLQGCRDFSPFLGINELLELWNTWGRESVLKKIQSLRKTTIEVFQKELGLRPLQSSDLSLQSPLLAFRLPVKISPREWNKKCLSARVQIHLVELADGAYLQLSPHIYNQDAQIERAAKIIKTIVFQ